MEKTYNTIKFEGELFFMNGFEMHNRLNEISSDREILKGIRQKVANDEKAISKEERLIDKLIDQLNKEEKELKDKLSRMDG